MNKTRKLFILLLWFMTSLGALSAQSTLIYEEGNKRFQDGLELLKGKLYLSAQSSFQEYIRIGTDPERKIEASYYLAYCALKAQQSDAESRLQSFLRQYPYHPKALDAYYQWAEEYYQREDYDRAIEFYEKVPSKGLSKDKQAERNFQLASAYFQKKRYSQAETYFNKLKDGNSQYAEASSYYAGYIAYKDERLEIALRDLQKAEESKEYALLSPVLISSIHYQNQDYNDLIDYASPRLQKNSNLKQAGDISLLLGDAYFFLQNFPEALRYYELGIKSNSKLSPEVYYRMAQAYYKERNFELASENFQTVADDNTDLGQNAAYYLGLSYLRLGNKRFAIRAFEQAKGRAFDEKVVQESTWLLGKLNYEQELYEEAIGYLKEFIEKYPNHPDRNEGLDLLSNAYLNSNKVDEALAYFESFPQRNTSMNVAYQQISFIKASELFNEGEFAASIPFFQRSRRNPSNQSLAKETLYWLGEAYLLSDQPKMAIPFYQEILGFNQPSFSYTAKTHYGLAYAYYNVGEYGRAIPHLQYYIARRSPEDDRTYLEDAFVRLADCYYATKDYTSALNNYNQVISLDYLDKDYAYFQKGVIANIQDNPSVARGSFETLIKQYPNSRFVAKAYYQKALVDLEMGSYAVAISGVTQLLQEKPGSTIIPDALLLRGLAYTNIGNQNAAIQDYKRVVNDHTTHPSASDALYSLQELLVDQGREAELNPLLTKYREANPNSNTTEKIYFENAKSAYFNQQYESAISQFRNYLNRYPQSPFISEAEYYTAESYYRLKDLDNALNFYSMVVKNPSSDFVTRSSQRAAQILYEKERYREAISYYRILASLTQRKREQLNAWVGLIESYYELQRYDSLDFFANQVLEQPDIAGSQSRALLFQGKVAYRQQNFGKAIGIFQKVSKDSQNETGAEAKYLEAEVLNKQKQYRNSLEVLFDLDKRFNAYENWRGRAFLLVADNYIALNEIFQAKATLQSLIDKSPDPKIRREASLKLQKLP